MAMNALLLPRRRPRAWVTVAVLAALFAVAALWWAYHDRTGTSAAGAPLEGQAKQFVTLGLTLGRLFPSEVDSYFGPAALTPSAGEPQPSLERLRNDLAQLDLALRDQPAANDDRHRRLAERTRRLLALVDIMRLPTPLPFDEEAQRLYGLAPASADERHYRETRAALDRLLPGGGSLTQRVEEFRRQFVIPEDRRQAVFTRALAECRKRTLQHWPLPRAERLDIEWTSDVGAAWHRYHGNFRSSLQINPQAVAFLGSATDVACHEAYPGHHAQFVLAEAAAGAGPRPVEDSIVLLRSPGSVIREAAADFGVSLVFPPDDRLAFERDVLFPMAGFPPSTAARFEQVRQLLDTLAPAALPILRAYRDRRINAEAAAATLDQEALIASPQALLAFVDTVGAYVTGYTGVREQVRGIVDAGGPPNDAVRWARLRCVVQLADAAPLGRVATAISAGFGASRPCENSFREIKQ